VASVRDLLRDPISWDGLREGVLRAAAYAVVFGTAAWARFSAKNITS
jgi:ABC-2 type transport system permease protein